MNKFEPQPNNKENGVESVKKDFTDAMESISTADIFDGEYLKKITLVMFDEQQIVFSGSDMRVVDGEFDAMDFMQGRRTDFVGIYSKDKFLKMDKENISDKKIIPFILFEGDITYEEFIVHELAHNIFDREYENKFGGYMDNGHRTEVSEEYREIFAKKAKELLLKHYPNIDVEKFSFTRQQICEIFAQAYQREYCFKKEINLEMHNSVFEKAQDFINNPQDNLDEFNNKNSRNCSIEDFYTENHTLSLLLAPILEQEFPDFDKRKEFFMNN